LDGAILDPPEFPEPLREGRDPCPCRRCRTRPQEGDGWHLRLLLRARRERPCCRRAPEKRDEFASLHVLPQPEGHTLAHRSAALCITAKFADVWQLWVIFVRSARSRRSRDVRFAPKDGVIGLPACG